MKKNKLLLFTTCLVLWSVFAARAQTYYINENFNSLSAGSTTPSGWSNNLISGSSSFDFFRFGQSGVFDAVGNPGTRTSNNSSVTGICAIFDSDNTSSGGGLENVALESPSFNTTGAVNVHVRWDQDYHGGYQSGDSINVEVFDGTSWIKVYEYGAFSTTGAAAIQNSPDIDVTSVLANKTGCKVRFRWRGNWSWWWMFDNVQVYSIPPTYYFIKEPFTTASGSTPPAGWSNNLISGSPSFDFWRFGQSGVFNSVGNPGTRTTGNSNMAGTFAIFDSDNTSSGGGLENVALESPVANTSGFSSNIHLKWDQDYHGGYQSGDSINVEVFDGTSWIQVYEYHAFATNGSAQIQNSPDIDVTSLVANKTNVKVRFRFRSNWSWWWIIDNVELYAPAPTPVPDFTINNASQCLPGNSFNFTNTSTIAGASSTMTYSWNFGDLTNSTATSPSGKTYASANTYTVTLTATSDLGVSASTSKTVTVNAVVTPSVSISASPSNTVCANQSVTFTATPTNGGTAPTYQWKKNGSNIATGVTWNAGTSLATGDAITCVMTSNYPCPTGGISIVTSNTVNMTVNPVLTPSVSIGVSPGNSFCPGTNAIFTATPTNGGTTPAYQWKKNSFNVGTNSATYADNTLTTGDVITCVMTSNTPCPTGGVATATSNGITINTSFPASVSIVASTSAPVCPGTSITFTATPTNGGTPAYQWKKNGGNVGTGLSTFTDAVAAGDVYSVQMTSSIVCASPKPATSNTIAPPTITPLVPSVVINKTPSTAICPGTAVSFTVTPTNGGFVPTYQWKLNGTNVATTNNWGSSSLNNGDVVSVVMTPGNNVCVAPATATGTTTITVNPVTPASVTISANPGNTICSGTSVTFTATPTGGGTPTYQWKRNGANVGTNSATYNAGTTLTNGNTIECVMTSSATCAIPQISNSNLITMNVNSTVTPSVTISTVPSGTACVGGVLQFVANPLNGGNTPSYQWKIDGNNVGTNFPSYTDNGTLTATAHTISVTMISSITQCITTTTATGTLNKTISPLVTPTISIASTQAPGGDACVGSSVTFTPTTTNAGSTPAYQWKKNGSLVATGSSYAPGATLVTGDIISCEMTSSAACASPVIVNSAPVNMTIWPNVTAAVTITSNPGNAVSCTGLPVTFTAAATNVGSNPTYQWKLNGNNVGTNSPTYVDAALATGNTVSCVVTTSIPCSTPKPATSNTLTMTMNPNLTASINVTATPDSVGCEKTPFTFNSFYTLGGTNPAFKWYKNGTPIPGASQAVYSSNSLVDGDMIACELISNGVCTAPVMSKPISIEIVPSPVPTLTIVGIPDNLGINFVATLTEGGQNPTFQWRKNGHDIQGATGPTYKGIGLAPADQINVFVHSDAECANPAFLLSNTLDVGKVTAINTVTSSFNELALFPNPNSGNFTVKGTAKTTANSQASVEVLNAVGQVVYKNTTVLRGSELEVDVNLGGHNAAGMYMLRVTVDGHTDNLRFIVKD
ncbi:PKD domain-containing protein [Polluticoccus soli]|uniref:PKD domain-containing protein n=1 Tax=Polluticoccus soli TaxID=3034150 RepID=UPI0023E1E281|nr:PKD domain-containing protein [Flavipsychrobacter sp. JY13-12]